MSDREAELWLPLFIVCGVAAPDRLEELKTVALRLSDAKQADEPAEFGVLLLRDIRGVFDQNQGNAHEFRQPSSALLSYLNQIDESPWPRWSRGQGLDARGLARLLKPFGISPHNLRFEDNTVAKGYERVDFEEAWATYLSPTLAATPLQGA